LSRLQPFEELRHHLSIKTTNKGFPGCNIQLFTLSGFKQIEERTMMPKKITFKDKAVGLEEIKAAMRETKDKRLFERYQCGHLLLLGESQKTSRG
jgi:hypothetical protein